MYTCMNMSKRISDKAKEQGRTLLETISVLVVVAILLISCLLGYSALRGYLNRQETVKQILELAVRYKLNPIAPNRPDGKIKIINIWPNPPHGPDPTTISTPDNKDSRISLRKLPDSTTFIVTVDSILPSSCQSLLMEGDFDAIILEKDIDLKTAKAELLSQENIFGREYIKAHPEIIEKICNPSPKIGLVYGSNCSKHKGSFWYEGKCFPCRHGQIEDKAKQCCSEGAINACGYCQGTGYTSCLLNPLNCYSDELVCDEDTKTCVQCVKASDCSCKGENLICSNNHCCPEGAEWDGFSCSYSCTESDECVGKCMDCDGLCLCGADGKCFCEHPSRCTEDSECTDQCGEECEGACLCGTDGKCFCEHSLGCTEDSECTDQCGEECEGACLCGTDGKCFCEHSLGCTEDSECTDQCGEECEGACLCGTDGKCFCEHSSGCTEDSECTDQCDEECKGICTCGENGNCFCDDACKTNEDCSKGFYCSFKENITSNCQKPGKGICLRAESIEVGDGTYISSATTMDYWSAQNFCDALGRSEVSFWSKCSAEVQEEALTSGTICPDWNMNNSDENLYWTNSEKASCSSFYTSFLRDEERGLKKWNDTSLRPLCQSCPAELPGEDAFCTQGCGCQKPYTCEKGINRCSCGETSGVIFFIDHSTSQKDANVKDSLTSLNNSEGEADWRRHSKELKSSLEKLTKINTAIYFQDYSSTFIKEQDEKMVNPLGFGKHTPEELEKWFDYMNMGGGASFKHALNDIKKYCKNNSQLMLLFFATNQNQHYRNSFAKELEYWREFADYAKNNCYFNIWLVGANPKIANAFASTKFNVSKQATAYEYIFENALSGSCTPRETKEGKVNTAFCSAIPANFPLTTKAICDVCPEGTRFWPESATYDSTRDSEQTQICYMCTHPWGIYTSQAECNRCGDIRSYNPTTRICSLASCYSSGAVRMTAEQCTSCRNTTSTEEGGEAIASEISDPTARFMSTNGYCYPCNIAGAIPATAEECGKCNGARSMSGAYCVKEVCDKTTNYSNMTREACHEMCTTEGQEAPYSHYWLDDGTALKNSCLSCSSTQAHKTTYEESARCIGTRFYSKKTGYSYHYIAGDVELSDASEGSEESVLCLAAPNRTIDEETGKCVKMDCSSGVSYGNVTEDICHSCGKATEEGGYRFFIKGNKTTQRGGCYSCSNPYNLSNSNIVSSDDFITEITDYCYGKRFIGYDNKTSYSCDLATQIQLSKKSEKIDNRLEKLCSACGNRTIMEKDGISYCVKMNCDENSKEVYYNVSKSTCHECSGRFWTEKNSNTHLGTCYPCTSDYTGAASTTLSECARCGTERYFTTPNAHGLGTCYSCTAAVAGVVGDDENRQDMCLACKGGNKRTVSSTKTCRLFDCDTSSYYTNMSEEQCHSVCGQTEDTPTYFWSTNKYCWPCQNTTEGRVYVRNPEECYRCNTGTQSSNTNHFYSTNGYCYQCFTSQSPKVSGEENCHDQCPNRYMDTNGNCVLFACQDTVITPKITQDECHACRGDASRFMNTSKQCISCNTKTDQVASTISETQQCRGKRFQAGTYSYSCVGSKSAPVITTEEEVELCEACPGRVVSQNNQGVKTCAKLDCSVPASYGNISQENCHESCEGGKAFWLSNKQCYSCLYTNVVANTSQEECSLCDNRYWYNKQCKICPNTTTGKSTEDGLSCIPYENQFFSSANNTAYLCSHVNQVQALASECARCNNRHMDGIYCKLCPNNTLSEDGVTCGVDLEGKFMGIDNSFHECTQSQNVTALKSECDRCDNRYWYNNSCNLCSDKTTGKATSDGLACQVADSKFFGTATNQAYDCSNATAVLSTLSGCTNCDNRYLDSKSNSKLCPEGARASTDRMSCETPKNKFLGTDNKFHECTQAQNVAALKSECDQCDNRYWYNNSCNLCSNKTTGKATSDGLACQVANDKFFGTALNSVNECSSTANNIVSVSASCRNCSKRYMENNMCKLCPDNVNANGDGVSCELEEGIFMGIDAKSYPCDTTASPRTTKEQCDRCIGKVGRFYVNNTCQLTPAGWYSDNGVKTACGTGYNCPDKGMEKPIVCEAGTYTDNVNSTTCTQCPKGYYCPGGTSKISCGQGYYCPDTKMTDHFECKPGTYSGTNNAQTCTVCPAGTYCLYSGMSAPTDCGVGNFCAETGRDYSPEPCPEGTYSSISKATTCSKCPKGFYCPGGTDRKNCGPGHYCPETGMSEVEYCSPGTYSAAQNTITCTACPAGTYCPDYGMSAPMDCGVGNFCSGTKREAYPEACPEGTYSSSPRATTCTKCQKGYYCPGGTDQKKCGQGNYCDESGMSNPKTCAEGTYAATDTLTVCTVCPAGQYQDEKGKNNCKNCSGNTVTTTSGGSVCTICEGNTPCSNAQHTKCVSSNTTGAIC